MVRTEDPGERRQACLAARARRSDSAYRWPDRSEFGISEEESWQAYR
jgi:hypothetical protein